MDDILQEPMFSSLLLGAAAAPNIAFTARIYYPYPDKRISHHRIYTLDSKNGQPNPISLPGQDCGRVMWSGKNRIVYEVRNKAHRHSNSIWTVTLPGGTPSLLVKQGFLRQDQNFSKGRDGDAIVQLESGAFKLVDPLSGKLKPFFPVQNSWLNPFEDEDGNDQRHIKASINSTDTNQPGSFVSLEEGVGFLVSEKGKSFQEVKFGYAIHDPESNRLWTYSHEYWRAYSLSRVRWDTGKVQELFVAGKIDWRPDRNQVAFVTQPDLSPYGPKKKVWTNELWMGELESGRKSRVSLPLSYLIDVAVSPT